MLCALVNVPVQCVHVSAGVRVTIIQVMFRRWGLIKDRMVVVIKGTSYFRAISQ